MFKNSFSPLHYSLVKKYIHNPVKLFVDQNANGNVLDIGCGNRPFYDSIKDRVKSYTGIDLYKDGEKNNIDVQSVADTLPFKDGSFDFVIFTQVIEHLENPSRALDESFRVLKHGGTLILAWPFIYPIHEYPRDFYRYTDMAIRYLAQKSGFKVQEIIPVSGFWITFFSFLSIYSYRKSANLYFFLYPLLFLFKALCTFLEKLDKKSKYKWTWSYYAILKREL